MEKGTRVKMRLKKQISKFSLEYYFMKSYAVKTIFFYGYSNMLFKRSAKRGPDLKIK